MNIESIKNVRAKDASAHNVHLIFPPESRMYAMKGAALLYTSFDEILFLDADNIPARDPTFLFETDAFRETGALFWKDYWMTKPNNPIYKILGLPCVDENEFESGQMVIKKSKKGVQEALELAFYMQRNAQVYYEFFHGDKDSFRFAWRYLNVPYHQVRPFPGIAGRKTQIDDNEDVLELGLMSDEVICGYAIVQFAPNYVSRIYGNPPNGHKEEELKAMFYHVNSFKDQPDSGLEYLEFYKGNIAIDGIANYFKDIDAKICLTLLNEGDGFRQDLAEIKIDPTFNEQYYEYYREWHK